jgi:hypothetical protein
LRNCSRPRRSGLCRLDPHTINLHRTCYKNGRLHLIPASDETRGHGTTGMAKFYKQQLEELLKAAPQRAM